MDGDMATRTELLPADEYLARVQRTHECSELVRGEVRPVSPASPLHNVVAGNLFLALALHVRQHRLGWCFTDNAGFRLPIPHTEGETIRSPDVAFVTFERLPQVTRGLAPIAPDLAVEVLAPDDSARDLWVVDPDRRTVAVHSDAAPTRRLRDTDALDGGEVVPGFVLPVRELFAGL